RRQVGASTLPLAGTDSAPPPSRGRGGGAGRSRGAGGGARPPPPPRGGGGGGGGGKAGAAVDAPRLRSRPPSQPSPVNGGRSRQAYPRASNGKYTRRTRRCSSPAPVSAC